jgi:glycerol-3-phosphate dehydrogenase (NAD(P)+)
VARITVFGAGAMGTAVAMHLARAGHDTTLWASEFDRPVLLKLVDGRRHPSLPEFLPDALRVLGPESLPEAGADLDAAVMGAHSGGARTLARIVCEGCGPAPLVIGLAKGLEVETLKRMSEVYAEEADHDRVASMGGPCLAAEIAGGAPSAAVFAAADLALAEGAAGMFRTKDFHSTVTDDLAGLEYCTVGKNVAAIGMGILDGMGKVSGAELRNAKAALFTLAFSDLVAFVTAMGGRGDTVHGLAGLGDSLVTSLGGRNRLFGELLGEGLEPKAALENLLQRGMTVEGVDSSQDVRTLSERAGLDLAFFDLVYRILFEGAPAASVVDCLQAL